MKNKYLNLGKEAKKINMSVVEVTGLPKPKTANRRIGVVVMTEDLNRKIKKYKLSGQGNGTYIDPNRNFMWDETRGGWYTFYGYKTSIEKIKEWGWL